MKQIGFLVTLLEDAVFTERSQSTGAAGSLDYIPGANFLGVVAKSYEAFEGIAFEVFHKGAVQFGNAYPVADSGELSLPAPLSWHYLKGTEYKDDKGTLLGSNLFNLASEKSKEWFSKWQNDGNQPKQLRTGYFTLSGRWITPQTDFRLKTAIDQTKSGKPVEALLFGYEALRSGSRLYFSINIDDNIPQQYIDKITSALNGVIRLGKSRSAEYSRTECKPVYYAASIPLENDNNGLFRLYLLSDAALRDQDTGAPSLKPELKNYGLGDKDCAFLTELLDYKSDTSYIRSRTYSPYNGTRRAFDLERQVLVKGSVITFETKRALNDGDFNKLKEIFSNGIGYYRHDGLGRVLLNPAFLTSENPVFNRSAETQFTAPDKKEIKPNGGELGAWLEKRSGQHAEIVAAREDANRILDSLSRACIAPGEKKPSASQWRQVAAIAMKAKDFQELAKALFGDKNLPEDERKGLCLHGVSRKQWSASIKHKDGRTSREVLATLTPENLTDGKKKLTFDYIRYRLYYLGVEMPKKMRQLDAAKGGGNE